jgi:copper chaperone CopZ
MIQDIIVENIKCGGCMNSIKTALLKIANVQDVIIDKETEKISIHSSAPIDRNEIVNQLAEMGYPEKGDNNLFMKAKSYVSCAIGNISEKIK